MTQPPYTHTTIVSSILFYSSAAANTYILHPSAPRLYGGGGGRGTCPAVMLLIPAIPSKEISQDIHLLLFGARWGWGGGGGGVYAAGGQNDDDDDGYIPSCARAVGHVL